MTDDVFDDGLGRLASITAVLRDLGLPHTELRPPDYDHPFVVGAAVQLDPGFAVVTVRKGAGPGAGYDFFVTSGVLLDLPRDDRLGILTVCNTITCDWGTPSCFLHDAEDTWSVLVQNKLPLPILNEAPRYVESILYMVASGGVEAAEKFGEAGIVGRRWTWDRPSLNLLTTKSVI